MSEYKLNSNLVTRNNIDKTDNIKNNNFNTPWKIFTTHLCHDPDSYGNINYYNQNNQIEFNNLDASNNNLYIENKKNDTIISVNENRKIKFEGITEFSNNSIFNGNIICDNILDISSIYTYSISSEIIKTNEIEGNIIFKGNVTISGEFSKTGEELSTLNLFNSNIFESNLLNCKIGISKTGQILRENAYLNSLNTNDISINNDLMINNNIFLKNIENNNFNYINFESISIDNSFNLKYNGINNILINNVEYSDINKFYLENTNYLINNNLEFEYNFAIYIKNRNYANILTTDPNIFTENYNNKNYNIIINNLNNVNSYKEFYINITGNFEYIDIIIFKGNNLNNGIINKTFEKIFLYKHDIDLINKLIVVDNSINLLIINNFTNNTEFNNVNIKNNLDVIENTTLYDSLEVHKNSILQDLSAGATDISSSLNVSGSTILNNTLTVTNKTILQDLSAGATDIISTLNVSDAVTLNNTLDVSGDTSVSTFDSTGATSLATGGGAVNIASSGQMTTVKGTLNVDEAVTLDSTLDVSGDTTVSTFDSTGATSLATGGGAVNIASSGQITNVKGTLNVDEAVTLDSTLDVSGDTSVSTFDSTGATSLATGGGAVNIASSGQMTTVKGTLNVDEAVTLDSTLDVTGDTSVSTFDSTGATSLATNSGAVNISSSGQITTIKGTLNVNEVVKLDSTLQIGSGSKGGQIYSTLTDHELVIDPFGLDTNSNSLEDASGVVTILGDLIVKGNTTTIHSINATFNNNLEISNNLIVNGDASFNNNLIVNGDASFNNNLEISNNLIVNGDASFNNNLDISNNLNIGNNLNVNQQINCDSITALNTFTQDYFIVYDNVNSNTTSKTWWYYSPSHFRALYHLSVSSWGYGERSCFIGPAGGGLAGCSAGNCYISVRNRSNTGDSGTNGSQNDGFTGSHPYAHVSDDRIKHNEKIIENGLNNIRQLVPKKYKKTPGKILPANFNGDLEDGTWFYESGLIAQEILKIEDLSWCVRGGDYIDNSGNNIEELYNVCYNNILMYHIAATKELDTIVQNQENEINNLKIENNDLKNENNLIKSKLNEILLEMGKETI
jgi:cytoskeletal protein CcmA (bactofilin family)